MPELFPLSSLRDRALLRSLDQRLQSGLVCLRRMAMQEVGLMTRESMERAYKLCHTELRARALVDSAVAFALQNEGEPEDRDFRKYAYEIATNATAMLMQYIYEGDAELKAIRVERDHYKKIAEAHLQFAPPFLALSDSDTHPKDGDVKQAPLVSGAAIAQKEAS